AGCNATCTSDERCGNGILDFGETCDDGTRVDGDGCSAGCVEEHPCGDGSLAPDEQCDDGNTTPGDGCQADCSVEGFVEACTAPCPDDDDPCTTAGCDFEAGCLLSGPTCFEGAMCHASAVETAGHCTGKARPVAAKVRRLAGAALRNVRSSERAARACGFVKS